MSSTRRNLAWPALCSSLLPLLTILLFSNHTRARATRLHLSWRHPVGSMCPTAAMLERDVEELVGTGQFVPLEEAQIIVRGDVKPSPTGFVAHLQVESAAGKVLGTRDLVAPAEDCASLRGTLAVVLIMLLDAPMERIADVRVSRNVVRFGASASLLSGALPRVTPGLGITFALDHDRDLRLQLDATYWLPVRVENAAGFGAMFQAVGLSTVLCPRLNRGATRFGVWLCGGAELGALHASALRLEQPTSQPTRLLAQAELEGVLSVRIRRSFELFAACGLAAALSRPSFYMQHASGARQELHRPAGVGVLFRLGLTIAGS